MHLGPGFYILRVVDGPLEELPENGQRVLGPNIRDGIRTLVRGSQDRVRGPRGPFQVADGREGLELAPRRQEGGREGVRRCGGGTPRSQP